MTPEDLLRVVPTIDEWLVTAERSSELHAGDIEKMIGAFFEELSVSIPALDDNGFPVMPPVDHVVDAFARSWLTIPAAEDEFRPGFGTVAVVHELGSCDVCGWAAARYESPIGRDRVWGLVCARCLVHHGDSRLGSGHAVLLLLPSQLPAEVVEIVGPFVPPHLHDSIWPLKHGDGWDGYRRWGFTGPDDDGRLYAVIGHVQLNVRAASLSVDAVELTSQSVEGYPGGWRPDTRYAAGARDSLDVRAVLVHRLRTDFSTPERAGVLEDYLRVGAAERDDRALRSVTGSEQSRWLFIGDHHVCASANQLMATEAANHSANRAVVATLARKHPDPNIRRAAVANRALSTPELARVAKSEGAVLMADELLKRRELPPAATRLLVEQMLLAGSLDRYAMFIAVAREDFPDDYLDAVIGRCIEAGTEARIGLAEVAHRASASRRDHIHRTLLRASRRVASTARLMEVVIGDDPTREVWLEKSQDPKILNLKRWWEEQRADT